MPLKMKIHAIPDPDGRNPALLLRGDWLIIEITDGKHAGFGEFSHSRDDEACQQMITHLFDVYVKDIDLDLEAIVKLTKGPFAQASSFVMATAISGLNQALTELVAKCENKPVWALFSERKHRSQMPVYATINRALTTRTLDDYREVVSQAVRQGFSAIKCAPFEKVKPEGDQIAQSQSGLVVLEFLRKNFPDLSIRIDFHERFHIDAFTAILPSIEAQGPHWLEAPIPLDSNYTHLKTLCQQKVALGELYFGHSGFAKLVEQGWADVIMPDVKHVGGFGPLLSVAQHFSTKAEVSPHNPSGPIATAASLQSAAIAPNVTSLEVPLILDQQRAYYLNRLQEGVLHIPDDAGWGVTDFQV